MGFKAINDWPEEVLNAGTRGEFNPLHDLERVLHEVFTDFRPYVIMFCSEEDLNSAMQIGWVHLKSEHFGYDAVKSFNKAVGLRFGMTLDVHNNIKVGGNYILYMPKSYREKIEKKRKEAYNVTQKTLDESLAVTMPGDPRASEMKSGAEEMSKKGTEQYTVQFRGEPGYDDAETKRGPGRPPKNK
jgi:hypothetical protein